MTFQPGRGSAEQASPGEKMTKWTEGPWFAIQHPDGWTIQDRPSGGGTMIARDYDPADQTIGPNARLIAAAPCVTEAAMHLVDRDVTIDGRFLHIPFEDHGDALQALTALRAALSRARGES